jgi:hypothetical protein
MKIYMRRCDKAAQLESKVIGVFIEEDLRRRSRKAEPESKVATTFHLSNLLEIVEENAAVVQSSDC